VRSLLALRCRWYRSFWELERVLAQKTPSDSARPQDRPAFRFSTPSLRGREASGVHPHRPDLSEGTWLSVYVSGIGTARAGETARPMLGNRELVALTQLHLGARSGGATFIPMMEPTQLGDRHDPPGFWCSDGA
jgi:hypothetical protein